MIIITVLSITLHKGSLGTILSVAATLTAIILGAVTIVSSIVQNNTLDNKLHHLDVKLDKINELKANIQELSNACTVNMKRIVDTLETAKGSGARFTPEQATLIDNIIDEIKQTEVEISNIRGDSNLFDI